MFTEEVIRQENIKNSKKKKSGSVFKIYIPELGSYSKIASNAWRLFLLP